MIRAARCSSEGRLSVPHAAKLLRPILGELVFVGGCATALLITDKAAADVRPTFDVDAIAEITSYAAYAEFSERLRKLGFREDAREGAPLCRWRQQTTTLDVMPLDEKVLGFSNTWYRPAMDHAEERELEKALKIRLVAPVYFCASKLEAFAGRGKNDFHASRDLEDLIAVVDGRAELVGEIQATASDVRSYLAKEIKKINRNLNMCFLGGPSTAAARLPTTANAANLFRCTAGLF